MTGTCFYVPLRNMVHDNNENPGIYVYKTGVFFRYNGIDKTKTPRVADPEVGK